MTDNSVNLIREYATIAKSSEYARGFCNGTTWTTGILIGALCLGIGYVIVNPDMPKDETHLKYKGIEYRLQEDETGRPIAIPLKAQTEQSSSIVPKSDYKINAEKD
ncbi:MAG: hypothetical protein RL557_117 [archaeon]|jgi:hypothetical protein